MRIGLIGGTFNPVHLGHLVLGQECHHLLKLDKVIFIPNRIPPHRTIEGKIPVKDRLAMVRLAVKNDSRFEVSDYEVKKKQTSYTVDTVKYFRKKYGEISRIFFIVGADWADRLGTWKDHEELFKMVTFVVANRPGYEASCGQDRKVINLEIPYMDISSTMIRNRIKRSDPVDFLIPEVVEKYITRKKLYLK